MLPVLTSIKAVDSDTLRVLSWALRKWYERTLASRELREDLVRAYNVHLQLASHSWFRNLLGAIMKDDCCADVCALGIGTRKLKWMRCGVYRRVRSSSHCATGNEDEACETSPILLSSPLLFAPVGGECNSCPEGGRCDGSCRRIPSHAATARGDLLVEGDLNSDAHTNHSNSLTHPHHSLTHSLPAHMCYYLKWSLC